MPQLLPSNRCPPISLLSHSLPFHCSAALCQSILVHCNANAISRSPLPFLFVASQCRCCPLLSVPELRRLCQCQRFPSIAVPGKSMPVPSESNPSPCSRCRRCAMFCSGDAMQRQSKAVPSQYCASPSPVSFSLGRAKLNFATACRIHSTPLHFTAPPCIAFAVPCFAYACAALLTASPVLP